MDYIFGKRGLFEVLKTKGDTHTNLSGFQQFTQEYPDRAITHYFRVNRKTESKEDTAGNCYDWYDIDRHYTVEDNTGPVVAKVEANAASVENALCEMDVVLEERLGAIEDALCELDGGN